MGPENDEVIKRYLFEINVCYAPILIFQKINTRTHVIARQSETGHC